MIYHQALTRAAAQLSLSVFYFEKDSVLELAAQARAKTARDFERQLKAVRDNRRTTLAQRSCCCLRRCDLSARISRATETRETTVEGPGLARCAA